jgi:cation:H+ antiporter
MSAKSCSDKRTQTIAPVCALLALAAGVIPLTSPSSLLWTAPSILAAALLIAWAAESAQFFIAQGFALAILAWLQTLPEFAVEAVLAWKQQVPLLMANLTGALRLLTGLGWPMVYATAAVFHRRRRASPLGAIHLSREHSVEVIGLFAAMLYSPVIFFKDSLQLADAAVLIVPYAAYLTVLGRLSPEKVESVEYLDTVPRAIVQASRPRRTAAIAILFVAGGLLIYFTAEPFLASLLAVSAALGIPTFVFVQWVAPFISEFPEKVSAFYWARTVERSSTGLMNMISSNINQWTLLMAMLPIVYALGRGSVAPIPLDPEQEVELLLTFAQSLLAALFLLDLRLTWWEAAGLFVLWLVQFALAPLAGGSVHRWVTTIYFSWCAVEIARAMAARRMPPAWREFLKIWRQRPFA